MSGTKPEAYLLGIINESSAGLGAKAYADVPATRPATFVTVERTGGQRTLFLDSGTYAVQAWASTRSKAADLAQRLADLLLTAPARYGRLASTTVVSVYNFPDPDSTQARYQATVTAVITTN